MRIKGTILLALSLFASACAGEKANAEFDVSSASYVMTGCRSFIARSGDLGTAFASGLCAGKVEAVAVFDSGICFPSEATVGQMIRVVVRYIDLRPARLHENFMILAPGSDDGDLFHGVTSPFAGLDRPLPKGDVTPRE